MNKFVVSCFILSVFGWHPVFGWWIFSVHNPNTTESNPSANNNEKNDPRYQDGRQAMENGYVSRGNNQQNGNYPMRSRWEEQQAQQRGPYYSGQYGQNRWEPARENGMNVANNNMEYQSRMDWRYRNPQNYEQMSTEHGDVEKVTAPNVNYLKSEDQQRESHNDQYQGENHFVRGDMEPQDPAVGTAPSTTENNYVEPSSEPNVNYPMRSRWEEEQREIHNMKYNGERYVQNEWDVRREGKIKDNAEGIPVSYIQVTNFEHRQPKNYNDARYSEINEQNVNRPFKHYSEDQQNERSSVENHIKPFPLGSFNWRTGIADSYVFEYHTPQPPKNTESVKETNLDSSRPIDPLKPHIQIIYASNYKLNHERKEVPSPTTTEINSVDREIVDNNVPNVVDYVKNTIESLGKQIKEKIQTAMDSSEVNNAHVEYVTDRSVNLPHEVVVNHEYPLEKSKPDINDYPFNQYDVSVEEITPIPIE